MHYGAYTALIVTLVILIILATVSISAMFGENGLIKKAQEAKQHQTNAIAMEEGEIDTLAEEYANVMAEDKNQEIVPEIEREEPKTQWDGPIASGFAGGDGSSSNPYLIYDASQLAYLAKIVNEGESCDNMHFTIIQDIDVQGYEWVPIGNNSKRYFNGSIQFNACAILNISIKNEQYDYRGLLGNVGEKASLENGSIRDTNVRGYNYVSVLAGKNQGLIQDIQLSNCTTVGNEDVGGIVGHNSGNISNTYISNGNISGINNVGGIAGYSSGIIENSGTSGGNIVGTSNYGPIVGKNEGKLIN